MFWIFIYDPLCEQEFQFGETKGKKIGSFLALEIFLAVLEFHWLEK